MHLVVITTSAVYCATSKKQTNIELPKNDSQTQRTIYKLDYVKVPVEI